MLELEDPCLALAVFERDLYSFVSHRPSLTDFYIHPCVCGAPPQPVLVIGAHKLEGEIVRLNKPFLVMRKRKLPREGVTPEKRRTSGASQQRAAGTTPSERSSAGEILEARGGGGTYFSGRISMSGHHARATSCYHLILRGLAPLTSNRESGGSRRRRAAHSGR